MDARETTPRRGPWVVREHLRSLWTRAHRTEPRPSSNPQETSEHAGPTPHHVPFLIHVAPAAPITARVRSPTVRTFRSVWGERDSGAATLRMAAPALSGFGRTHERPPIRARRGLPPDLQGRSRRTRSTLALHAGRIRVRAQAVKQDTLVQRPFRMCLHQVPATGRPER